MRNFKEFPVDQNAMHLGSGSHDKLVFERGLEADEFKARIAAKIRVEQDRVFLDRYKNLQYFWSKSLYAKIKVKGRAQPLQLIVGYKLDESSQDAVLVYGLLVNADDELAGKYENLPWGQFPYGLGNRENQVLVCLSEEECSQLQIESVLSSSESPNAAHVRQVLLGRAVGAAQGRADDLSLFEMDAPGSQQEESLCFLDEDEQARFERTRGLLAPNQKAALLTTAKEMIERIVLSEAVKALPKSKMLSSRGQRIAQFSRSVFSSYCEVAGEGKLETIRLKQGVELNSAVIQAMGLRDNQNIKSQLVVIDDIEFASSVVSASRLIKLAYNAIKVQMDRELEAIPASAILRYDHSQGQVVCFRSSMALHDNQVSFASDQFALTDDIFNRFVRNILISTQGCFKPSEEGFAAIRQKMESELKQAAKRLLTSRYSAATSAAEAPAVVPPPVPAEQLFKQISAATLLAAAQDAYKGKSKYRYSTLFSAPRSKFMRELVKYLTEQGVNDIGLYALAKAMNARMEISDKCCGLFVSADDKRGVSRANALDQAEKNQEVIGLGDKYRTDRAIKAVLAQFGRGAS